MEISSLGLGLTAMEISSLGLGLTAFATIQQGAAMQAQAENEAAIAEYNAKLKEREAQERRLAAQYKADIQEKKGERLMGTQRALYGRASVLSSGTPASVLIDTATELEMDRLMILREGEVGYGQSMSESAINKLRAQTAKARGRSAFMGSILSAGGTVLTGWR